MSTSSLSEKIVIVRRTRSNVEGTKTCPTQTSLHPHSACLAVSSVSSLIEFGFTFAVCYCCYLLLLLFAVVVVVLVVVVVIVDRDLLEMSLRRRVIEITHK